MEDISEYILDYKECLKGLWNKHFLKDSVLSSDFKFETDKAFALIDQGLFESLVIAKNFNYSIERVHGEFYSQIEVSPLIDHITGLCAKRNGTTWNWKVINIRKSDGIFNYISLFDWEPNKEMKCELVRTRLTESNTLPNYVGYDFLFDLTEVRYLKVNK